VIEQRRENGDEAPVVISGKSKRGRVAWQGAAFLMVQVILPDHETCREVPARSRQNSPVR
jgi:hypothetical protein